ncbi:DNA repair protein RadA [Haematospirillum jordaniae]|uniref:DNA repair protein RadA n=1 Tax=Haematospirillum jordaniae TaxID=1549855 RepID=A0A143DDJ2_9PROT|nr:DNA repair protein RadA [Haematospirillum jordaniae]AMW34775.1 DNA repair protein RadA [Haematospirillum jordaniae]NKD56862.1 DNA repair protein RadA [Haematospirillum jordaniae]NKD58982.1 DNA repair protein RadA [Haematospirillum jordaniae]NKD66787.1 DNA repair protein RadA [Haematospirillum jordaniae]NKD78984.1 DNA repair protein RadA [Haematospirillum jordaniae]
MARAASQFSCQSCGSVFPRWAGRCDGCGEWNTLVEENRPGTGPKAMAGAKSGRRIDLVGLEGQSKIPPRMPTGIAELDRVCGGGLVPGSALLVGGDPGIGKSTLLLQAAAALAGTGLKVAYISGEEAVDQVRLRAARLGLSPATVGLASATNVGDIVATLEENDRPQVVVIDSIQTMYLDTLDSAPGSVAQVRACSHELIRLAKRRGFALFLVGHVTKEGALAGPRVMEHMVDTVLYFEGERGHHFRILRAVKNRFGATDEIGVFEMTDTGLGEVLNPSALFLAERRGNISGSCVFAGIEGTRPVLVEIQALVSSSGGGSPRRAVVGWDSSRLSMIMAVLEARCGLALGSNDVYLNVAGGLRIGEPAADLAVAAALVSAACGTPVPADLAVFGEVGLSGEIRAVTQGEARLKEAAKLGFAEALSPRRRQKPGARGGTGTVDGMAVREIGHLQDLVALFPAKALRKQDCDAEA